MTELFAAPTRRLVLAGLAAATFAGPAFAAAPPRAALAPADQADLDRIQAYLNGIKTVTGKFEQTNPDGSIATGTIWLARPGRMRFEYDPPTKLLIVCDGEFIEVDDKAANDIQFLPVRETPAWLMLREGIQLSGEVTVTRFERGVKSFRVTTVQTGDRSDSALTMVFADAPLALRQWVVVDPEGRGTDVALLDLQETATLRNDLFVLPDGKSNTRKRGR